MVSDYPFQPKTYLVEDGHRMSYLDEGQGKVIVMVHGNPTWSFFYRNLILLLKDRYRIIVPDHLGCGLSDKPRDYPYRLNNHVENLDRLLAHLKIDRHSMVVHDWGGAIGFGYAERYPERIESLMILNTAAFRSQRIPFRIKICRIPFLGPILVRGLNGFVRAALMMAVTKRLPKKVRQGYLDPYDSWAHRVAIQRFIEDIPLGAAHPSWKMLKKVEAGLSQFRNRPVLILWGGKDFCFNDHFFKEWQKRFPEARCIYMENAGHYVLEDAGQEVDHLINSFFAEHLFS
ncbi:MAG: alpha/beta fold hydrolase [Proteobacteria bacterium]|nr:alpha/beta fold hydrolase [Pseudomonadota bacterium]MBU1686551.1 alpha/beta fold hydrolase [Pseudomonadota bacterium]